MRSLSFAALTAALFVSTASAQAPSDFEIEIRLDQAPALSQGRTGTCWSYATTSFFEAEAMRITGEPVDLSEMYTVRMAYLEKARRYIRLHGKTQFSQGGLSHDMVMVAQKYGVVPAVEFDGLLPEQKIHNHGALERELTALVAEYAKGKKMEKTWHEAVSEVLDRTLGEVPKTVKVGDKEVSPQEYAKSTLKLPLNDYVEMMSFQEQGFGQRGELLVPDNWMRYSDYWNVPVNEMMATIDHALERGYTIALDCDVSEPNANARKGVFKLSEKAESEPVTDAERQRLFDIRQTTDDHLMHIVGRAKTKDGGVYYITKNSWGQIGPFDGYVMISRNFVAMKTVGIMVHKDGIPAEVRAAFTKN